MARRERETDGRREREAYYEELLDEQEESGLTVAGFAEETGLSAATLYSWRRRLGRAATRGGAAALVEVCVSDVAAVREARGRIIPIDELRVEANAGGFDTGALLLTVRWEEDKKPAEGIGVRLMNSTPTGRKRVNATTDDDGQITFAGLFPGRVHLSLDRGTSTSTFISPGATSARELLIPELEALSVRTCTSDGDSIGQCEVWMGARSVKAVAHKVGTTDTI